MVPNLNKWKFTKLHRKKRIINLGKGNKGRKFSVYNSGIVIKQSRIIKINQFDSLKKFINKRLRNKDRINKRNFAQNQVQAKKIKKIKKDKKEKTVILRRNFNLGLTKKPLQVRMGKGKGSPVDWVYPMAKNRVLLEFVVKKFKLSKLARIFKKAEKKLPSKTKIRINYNKQPSKKKFNKFNKLVNIKCVKEL